MVSPAVHESPKASSSDKVAKKGGGVRWYIGFEHAAQTTRLGLTPIKTEYVDECVAKEYSKKSAKKLQEHLDDGCQSAAAERIFSQMKLILEEIQTGGLAHDNIEVRLFERLNDYKV